MPIEDDGGEAVDTKDSTVVAFPASHTMGTKIAKSELQLARTRGRSVQCAIPVEAMGRYAGFLHTPRHGKSHRIAVVQLPHRSM